VKHAGLLIAVSLSVGVFAQGQTVNAPPEPRVGQLGKDVGWVPTSQALLGQMLDMAGVTSRDYVIDLGSGDGRMVIAAAKRGARGLGIEYDASLVELATRNAAAEGVTASARFVKADLFESDLSQATVITMYLLPEINLKLRPKLLALAPGTRIVSNTFTMDDWDADETTTVRTGCFDWCTALLWVVPANVEGVWRTSQGTLKIAQTFQTFTGTLTSGGATVGIEGGRLQGDRIGFAAGGARYGGRTAGNSIEGTVTSSDAVLPWTAQRTDIAPR
jgi:precorrin-6B methylase 2